MQNTNLEIRKAAKESGVFLWQIAEAVGLTDVSFSRKLRHELTEEEKNKILAIIEELRREAV